MSTEEQRTKAFRFTAKWEGGMADVEDDRGGLTLRGVTQARYDTYRRSMNLPERSVKRAGAIEINHVWAQEWRAARADGLPWPLGALLFDFRFHSGVWGPRYLQRAVNRLWGKEVLEEDGIIGPATRDMIERLVDSGNLVELMLLYLAMRESFLLDIVNRDRTQEKFLLGWFNRTKDALDTFVAPKL